MNQQKYIEACVTTVKAQGTLRVIVAKVNRLSSTLGIDNVDPRLFCRSIDATRKEVAEFLAQLDELEAAFVPGGA